MSIAHIIMQSINTRTKANNEIREKSMTDSVIRYSTILSCILYYSIHRVTIVLYCNNNETTNRKITV